MKLGPEYIKLIFSHLTGGGRLLELIKASDQQVYLVGGSIRDQLLHKLSNRPDLDLIVLGDAIPYAEQIAEQLERPVKTHSRFGTATIKLVNGSVDFVTARKESYPQPGALPEVTPSTLSEDLKRRDFTVNTFAIALTGPGPNQLICSEQAEEDLTQRQLRILHPRSFYDDPTRLLRAARYGGRLNFKLERETQIAAEEAIRSGALQTISDERVAHELKLILSEQTAIQQLELASQLGVLSELKPKLTFNGQKAQLAAGLVNSYEQELLLLALLLQDQDPGLTLADVRSITLTGSQLKRALDVGQRARLLTNELRRVKDDVELYRSCRFELPQTVALAAELDTQNQAERWLKELRYIKIEITGKNLIRRGVKPGQTLAMALEAALEAKIMGKADTPEQQLHVALTTAKRIEKLASQ